MVFLALKIKKKSKRMHSTQANEARNLSYRYACYRAALPISGYPNIYMTLSFGRADCFHVINTYFIVPPFDAEEAHLLFSRWGREITWFVIIIASAKNVANGPPPKKSIRDLRPLAGSLVNIKRSSERRVLEMFSSQCAVHVSAAASFAAAMHWTLSTAGANGSIVSHVL